MSETKNNFDYDSYEFSTDLLKSVNKTNCCCKPCKKEDRDYKNILFIQKWLYAHAESLSDDDRELIIMRYSQIILRIRRKLLGAQRAHTGTTIFTGVASILVTSFISINNINTNASVNQSAILWWASWSLSLAISIANSMSAFYKWERKYLMLFTIYNSLEREVFLFLEGVAPYCTVDETDMLLPTNHKDHLKQFLFKLETLNKRLNDSLLDIEQEDQNNSNSTVSTPKKHMKTPIILSSPNKKFITTDGLYAYGTKKKETNEHENKIKMVDV